MHIRRVQSDRRQVEMGCCCCLRMTQRAQLLYMGAWVVHLIGDDAARTTIDMNEVENTITYLCHPYSGNGGRIMVFEL